MFDSRSPDRKQLVFQRVLALGLFSYFAGYLVFRLFRDGWKVDLVVVSICLIAALTIVPDLVRAFRSTPR